MFLSSGPLWMVMSAFLYSLQNVGARFSGNGFGFWTLCVFRGLVGSLCCIIWLLWKRPTISCRQNTGLLLLRSVLGGITILSSFYALLKCGISTTTILTSTSSLWTILLSPKKQKTDMWVALWCLAGVVIVSYSQHEGTYYYVGVGSAILSAISQSGVNLTIKQLDSEDPVWVSLWGMAGSVVMGMPGLIYDTGHHKHHFFTKSTTTMEWVSLMTTGVLSMAAQSCKTHSIQVSHSMSVLLLRHMEVIFSVIWGMLLFHETISWQTAIGILILLSGCIATARHRPPPPTPPLPLTTV